MEAEVGGMVYNNPQVNESEKLSEGLLHDPGLLVLILDEISEYSELILEFSTHPDVPCKPFGSSASSLLLPLVLQALPSGHQIFPSGPCIYFHLPCTFSSCASNLLYIPCLNYELVN